MSGEPPVNDFHDDLADVLSKHGFSKSLAPYLIRDIDNLRETWPKVSVLNAASVENAMGSETP